MIRLVLISFLVLSGCDWMRPTLRDKVVIDVNGRQMTAKEMARELSYRLRDQDALSAKDPKYLAVVKARIVEDFIVQVLSEEWARENGVVVKAEDLEAEIQAVKNSYPDDLAFQQTLAEEGLTFKEWRDRLAATLLQKAVSRQVSANITPPTEAEMLAYYNENQKDFSVRETAQIRQILVETEHEAKMIDQELRRGRRMVDLAKKYSKSPEGSQGGVVGWIEKGMSEIFESAFRMKQGQRSPIVKSAFGYHLFEVIGRKPARTQPFTQVRDEIKSILVEKKQQALYLAWLEERVRKARVFRDQAFIDALKVETR